MGSIFIETDDGKRSRRHRFLVCKKCGRSFGYIGRDVKRFNLTFICRCQGLARIKSRNCDVEGDGATAIYANGVISCPVCKGVLLNINSHSITNFAFRIACSCGNVYDRYRVIKKKSRNLGRFASLEEE